MEFGFISQKVNIFPGPLSRYMHAFLSYPGPVGLAAPAVSASCLWLPASLPWKLVEDTEADPQGTEVL